MDDFNPYTAPEAVVSASPLATEADEGRGVWRDDKILVMVKIARLPSRCVKCNAPATFRLKRSLSWHNPWLFLMVIFPGLLFYVIVALIVRKTAKVEFPLCNEHRSRRSKGILIAWLIALAGIGVCFTPLVIPDDGLKGLAVVIGVITLIAGMIFGSLRSQVATPQKIDKTHVWLKGIGASYLATLPALPYSDDREGAAEAKPKIALDDF